MKYEEENISRGNDKKNTGIIIAIAVAIIIIALAAWFALSRYKGNMGGGMISQIKSELSSTFHDTGSDLSSMYDDLKSDLNSLVSENRSEYNGSDPSYNSTTSDGVSSNSITPTGDGINSVPYSEGFCKPCEGEISKQFSDKELVYSKTFGDMRLHSGVDISCKKGTAVSACSNGKIIGIDESSQYGTVVSIELSGSLTAKYSSITDLKVKLGDEVKSGDIIGITATVPAECNDKEHLHFEIYKNGIAVDPYEALDLE